MTHKKVKCRQNQTFNYLYRELLPLQSSSVSERTIFHTLFQKETGFLLLQHFTVSYAILGITHSTPNTTTTKFLNSIAIAHTHLLIHNPYQNKIFLFSNPSSMHLKIPHHLNSTNVHSQLEKIARKHYKFAVTYHNKTFRVQHFACICPIKTKEINAAK